jgi:hypothetical protein
LFVVLLVADTEFEFALLGAEHDRLAVHPPHHVEGRLRFAAQSQFEQIFGNALFDGLAQLRLDLEKAVGRAKAFDALVRPLVVVIFNPEFDAFPGGVEAVELGAAQELLPDRLPEAFDFAQSHWMMWPRLEVRDAILFEFGFKAAGAAPTGILAAVVGEHFLGRLELAHRDAIHFDHRRGRGAAEQVRTHDEPRVIVHEGDEIGVTPAQPKRENIGLPHLVGCGALKETRAGDIPLFRRGTFRHQSRIVQPVAHRLRAGRQQEPPAQQLADALDAEGGMLPLQFDDFVRDRDRQSGLAPCFFDWLQSGLATEPVGLQP